MRAPAKDIVAVAADAPQDGAVERRAQRDGEPRIRREQSDTAQAAVIERLGAGDLKLHQRDKGRVADTRCQIIQTVAETAEIFQWQVAAAGGAILADVA